MFEPIKVEGLAELTRKLKAIDSAAPKELRVANNQAADLLIGKTRPKIPKRTGRAQRSLKARSTRGAVRISAGGNRAPHYPWLDFGGRVGRRKSIKRPFLKDGRYLYATYYDLRMSGQFQDVLGKALRQVAADAGLEVD